MRIAVAGATGVVGREVAAHAAADGHELVALSRRGGVDLRDGTGLAERLEGVDAVIDCLSVVTTSGKTSAEFFEATTRNLLAAGERAGVGHHLVLSIVGIDAAPSGYYAGKVAQERLVRDSGRPATILRATQFHQFAVQMTERARLGPIIAAPRMRCAPVAAAEVAAALVELVTQPARSGTPVEIGGPEERDMVDMVRAVARRRGLRAGVVPMRMPGAAGRAMRDGALVPLQPWRVGKQTFDAWLQAQPAGR